MLLLEKIFGWIWLASVSGAVVGLALLLLKKAAARPLEPRLAVCAVADRICQALAAYGTSQSLQRVQCAAAQSSTDADCAQRH